MDIQTEVKKGVLTITVKGEYAIVVEGTNSKDVLYFEVRHWRDKDKDYAETRWFFLEKDMIIPLIRALAVVMKIEHHAIDNIVWLVSHELENYNYISHELKNPNRLV